jgi:hypothetical protein
LIKGTFYTAAGRIKGRVRNDTAEGVGLGSKITRVPECLILFYREQRTSDKRN